MTRHLMRIALVGPLLALGLVPAVSTSAVAAGSAASVPSVAASAAASGPSLRQVQLQILQQTNRYRERAGLRPLRLDAAMSRVATRWSQRQADEHEMSHNPSYPRQIPAGWQRCGENVAYGYSYRQVTAAWFHSPPHRENLLGKYGRIGIGFAVDSHGVAYYTQDFGTY